ncbi:MAG: hypothetical protein KBC96_12510 [Armatimonadetes bacterium]|nr:hypothetical protein [Armatimonadota bacterium]
MRKLAVAAIALIVFVLFAFGPGIVYRPATLVHIEADRTGPSRRIIARDFRLKEYSREFTLSVKSGIDRSDFLVQLFDGSGTMLVQMSFKPQYNNSFPFNVGRGFAPGRYQLRVVEKGIVGRYSVSLYQGRLPDASPSQLLLVTLGVVISAGCYGYALRRSGGDRRAPGVRKARYVLGCLLFSFTMIVGYPLVHETGHAIALASFHRLDLRGCDFIGLHGEPHVSWTAGPDLPGWPGAIIGISGPMLPNIVGYLMFAFWLSPLGRRWLARSSARDVFWSGITACMLFAQVGAFAPMSGLVHDGDYSGYIGNIPIPHWQANAFLLLLSTVNAVIIYTIVKHLVKTHARKLPPAGEGIRRGSGQTV